MAGTKTLLLQTLDDVWAKEGWIDPITQALEGVTLEEANWHTSPGVHSIVEIVNHMAYWTDFCAHGLQGRSIEDLKPIPKSGEAPATMPGWPEALSNLIAKHQQLRSAIAAFREEDLDRVIPGWERSAALLINALITHNSYHGGQIVCLRQLWAAKKK